MRSSMLKKLKVAFAHEKVFKETKATKYGRDVGTAFKLLYPHSFSLMCDGTTFSRRYKGRPRMSRFTIEKFIYVKDWTIENRGFRELMRFHNKPRCYFIWTHLTSHLRRNTSTVLPWKISGT